MQTTGYIGVQKLWIKVRVALFLVHTPLKVVEIDLSIASRGGTVFAESTRCERNEMSKRNEKEMRGGEGNERMRQTRRKALYRSDIPTYPFTAETKKCSLGVGGEGTQG